MEGIGLPAQATVETEGGHSYRVQCQIVKSHGARVEETKFAYIFKNSDVRNKNLIVPKVYWDEYYQPAAAAKELINLMDLDGLKNHIQRTRLKDKQESNSKKSTRKELLAVIAKNCESAEEVFRWANDKVILKYLETHGYKGFKGTDSSDIKLIALSLACYLFKKNHRKELIKAGKVSELPAQSNCKKCINQTHSAKKCKITQKWLRQGLSVQEAVPTPSPDNTEVGPRKQYAIDGSVIPTTATKFLNARQKRAKKNADLNKNATFCFLTEERLRQFHWQISRSIRCMRVFQSYVERQGDYGVPDDLREIALNVDVAAKESKTPYPYHPVAISPSARCIPHTLLREIHYIAMKYITRLADIKELDALPPLRAKSMAHLSWTNYSIYDPFIEGELEGEWVDRGSVEADSPAKAATSQSNSSAGEGEKESNFPRETVTKCEGSDFNKEKRCKEIRDEMQVLERHPVLKEGIEAIAERASNGEASNGELSYKLIRNLNEWRGINSQAEETLDKVNLEKWRKLESEFNEESVAARRVTKKILGFEVDDLSTQLTQILLPSQIRIARRFLDSVATQH